MNSSDPNRLARDILREGDYPAHRRQAAAAGLAELRRRRRAARAPWLALAAAAALALTFGPLWLNRPPSTNPVAANPAPPAPATANPPPLVATLNTATQPNATRFATQPHPQARIPATSGATFATLPAAIPRLTDDQLLALFPNQPAGFATLETGQRTFLVLHASNN